MKYNTIEHKITEYNEGDKPEFCKLRNTQRECGGDCDNSEKEEYMVMQQFTEAAKKCLEAALSPIGVFRQDQE